MRRWFRAATPCARRVADSPELWLPGGLAWAVTAAPVALLVAVVPPPSASDLTYLGARFFVATAWPWNVVGLVALTAGALVAILLLVSLADVALLWPPRARPTAATLRATLVSLVLALPIAMAFALLTVAFVIAATLEFLAPDSTAGGPLVRTLLRIAPMVAAAALFAAGVGALATLARLNVIRGAGASGALAHSATALRAAGAAGLTHLVVAAGARLAYLVVSAVLLSVLWAPIGVRLAGGAGFGPGDVALLVGFVAIWLCLVLGGGAVHAWGTVTWASILSGPTSPEADRRETPSTP